MSGTDYVTEIFNERVMKALKRLGGKATIGLIANEANIRRGIISILTDLRASGKVDFLPDNITTETEVTVVGA